LIGSLTLSQAERPVDLPIDAQHDDRATHGQASVSFYRTWTCPGLVDGFPFALTIDRKRGLRWLSAPAFVCRRPRSTTSSCWSSDRAALGAPAGQPRCYRPRESEVF
jgi:hypothetical protein